MAFSLGIKKKKKQTNEMTNAEEKRKAEENRAKSEEIKSALMLAGIECDKLLGRAEKDISPFKVEDVAGYKKVIGALIKKLDDQKASIADTVIIDKMLCDFAEQLSDDFKAMNAHGARYVLGALSYGIKTGKAEIYSHDTDYIKKILDSRREYLTRYEQIARFARQMDESERSIERYRKNVERSKIEYAKAHEQMTKKKNKMPGLQDELDKLRVGVPVSSDVISFNNLHRQVVNMFNDIKNMKKTIALNETECASCLDAIKNIQIQMDKMDSMIGQELLDEMKQSNEEYMKFLNEQLDRIQEIQKISDQFNNIMQSVTSSRKLIDMMISTEDDYKEMTDEMKEREASDERGRQKLEEEKELEEEMERLQMDILN